MDHFSRAELARVVEDTIGERISGQTPQQYYETSLTQKYELGARLMLPNPRRVFYYGHVINVAGMGAAGRPVIATSAGVERGAFAGIQTLGAFAVTWTSVGVVTLNQFVNGFFVADSVAYKILSNTAAAGAGVVITLTLERPIMTGHAAGDWMGAGATTEMLVEHPYSNVAHRGLAPYANVPGLCVGVIVAESPLRVGNYYHWLQTWGPCAVMIDNITMGNANGEATWCVGQNPGEEVNVYTSVIGPFPTADRSYQIIGHNIPSNAVNNIDSQWGLLDLCICP